MTTLLEQAFTEAARLAEDDQKALAVWILAEIASEKRWQETFARSQDLLSELGDEALADFKRGETIELDPDTL